MRDVTKEQWSRKLSLSSEKNHQLSRIDWKTPKVESLMWQDQKVSFYIKIRNHRINLLEITHWGIDVKLTLQFHIGRLYFTKKNVFILLSSCNLNAKEILKERALEHQKPELPFRIGFLMKKGNTSYLLNESSNTCDNEVTVAYHL